MTRLERKIRYLVIKPGRGGHDRHFWQPSAELRARGFQSIRLSDDLWDATREAERRNIELNAWRSKTMSVFPEQSAAPRPFDRRPPTGVYVIGCLDGPVKIGISKNPAKRLSQLRNGNSAPIELLFFISALPLPANQIEPDVHRVLHNSRMRGEWFEIDAIRAIRAVNRVIGSAPDTQVEQ